MTRTGDPARDRLRHMLITRRVELNPDFASRRVFAAHPDTVLSYSAIRDLETGNRANFDESTLLRADMSYRFEAGLIERFLNGGDERSRPAARRRHGRAPNPHRSKREVVEIQLRNDVPTGVKDARDQRRVGVGYVALQERRAAGHRHPSHRNIVLDTDALPSQFAGCRALHRAPPDDRIVRIALRVWTRARIAIRVLSGGGVNGIRSRASSVSNIPGISAWKSFNSSALK